MRHSHAIAKLFHRRRRLDVVAAVVSRRELAEPEIQACLRVGRVAGRPFPVHAVLNHHQPVIQTLSVIRASPKPAAAFMLKIVSWSTGHGFTGHGFTRTDFLHSFFWVEKLPAVCNH
jgi:hypothetical protein